MKGLNPVRYCLLMVCLLLLGGPLLPVYAQGIVTDRPDFTESAVTVPLRVLQLEAGGTYNRFSEHFNESVLGEGLLRWGVRRNLEVRVGLPSFLSASNGKTHSGLGDGSIGAKLQLGPVGDAWDLAAIASLSMPIGEDEFSSGKVDPTLVLATGRSLNENVGVGGQLTASWASSDDDRDFEWGATIVLSTGVSTDVAAFVEMAVTVPESGSAPLVGHAGLVYGVSDTFQLDVHAGLGLTDSAPDAFVGAGFAAQL